MELFAHGGTAEVDGTISAEDGFVETSGEKLSIKETINIKAKDWLLDPTNITIGSSGDETLSGDPATTTTDGDVTISSSTIESSLNSGTNVTLEATNNITVNDAIEKTAGGDASLTLKARRQININNSIGSTNGKLNVILWSNTDGQGGIGSNASNIGLSSGTISTNGGHLWVGGGDTSNNWNGLTVGNGAVEVSNGAGAWNAVAFQGDINTTGISDDGSFYVAAKTHQTESGATDIGFTYLTGQEITINTGTGDIEIYGNEVYFDGENSRSSGTTINTTGSLTIAPFGNSFQDNDVSNTTDFYWSGSSSGNDFIGSNTLNGLTLKNISSLTGLTIGKSTNTSKVLIEKDINISGPVSIYGGNVDIDADITSTNGNILIDTDTGSILEIESDGIRIDNSTTIRTITAGDITLLGRSSEGDSSSLVGVELGHNSSIQAAGNISITGISESSPSSTTGYGVWLAGSMSASGNVNITGESANYDYDVYLVNSNTRTSTDSSIITTDGNITIEALNSGRVSFGGNKDYEIKSTSGNIELLADKHSVYSSIEANITTSGSLSMLARPNDGSVASFVESIDLTKYFFGSDISSLIIGDPTNSKDIIIGKDISISGPINIYARDININEDIISSLINEDIILKATGDITSADNITLKSNNGNITLWADSDANNDGYIGLEQNININTANGLTDQDSGGGKITLAGGSDDGSNNGTANDGIPDGFAFAKSTTAGTWSDLGEKTGGINIGTDSYTTAENRISFYSGGGDIKVNGKSDHGLGIMLLGSSTGSTQMIDAGSGTIEFSGVNLNTWHGIEFNAFGGSTLTLKSSSDETTAISIYGEVQGNQTTDYQAGFQGNANIYSYGEGGVDFTGKTSSSVYNGIIGNINTYVNSGDITFTGDSANSSSHININGTFGNDGSDITDSSSDIIFIGDDINFTSSSSISTTGEVTLKPLENSFISELSSQLSNLSLSGNETGLTIGKEENTADITIDSSTTISGPINIYGGDINVNANLDTQGGGATGDILLKAADNITQGGDVNITSNGGDIIYWADSDVDDSGYISFHNDGGQDVITNGGDVILAGGEGTTVPTGYANGSTTNDGILISTDTASPIINTSKSSSTGGNITLRGKTSGNFDGIYLQNNQFFGNNLILDGQTGNAINYGVRLGSSAVYNGSNMSQVIDIENDLTITAVNTASNFTGKALRTGANPRVYADGNITLNTSGKLEYTSAQDFLNIEPNKILSINFDGTATFDTKLGDPNNNVQQGSLIIQSYVEDSFTSEFDSSNWTFNSNLSGLTIGKTTNITDITINNDTTISGPITLYGGDINVNANLDTQGGNDNGDVLLKSSADIILALDKSIITDGGDTILWSNSDGGVNFGSVMLRKGSTVETNGGHFWIGGGSGNTSWNGLTVGDGYAVAGTAINAGDSYVASSTDFNTAVYLEGTTINTSGGDLAMYGQAGAGYSSGFATLGVNSISTSSGKVYIEGNADLGSRGGNFHIHNSRYAGSTTITSSNSSDDAIVMSFNATNGSSYGSALSGEVNLLATNGGGVNYTSFSESNSYGIRLGYSNIEDGVLNLFANTGAITLNSGQNGLLKSTGLGSSSINFGRKAGTDVTTSSSDITVILDDISDSNLLNFATSGSITIKPTTGNSFINSLDIGTYSSDVSGLTIGHADNTGDISVGTSTSIAGSIGLYGGDITINDKLEATGTNTITLDGSGNVTDGASGYVVSSNLLLSDGAVTLNNLLNDTDNIAASGVDSLTFYDTDDIAIGSTIGSSTGISSSGNVILSSGADESVGTTTGGNITISGDPTISSSSGNVKLYSGSIDGSTGVTTLVGSGSGNFRYNSDETTTNFTTALGSTGIYAIYREQPSVSGTISSGTITYGDANPSFSLSGGSGLENGDSSSGFTIASSSYSTANKLEASASAYTVNASGLANLGYNISSITNGSLTVNQKTLSVADLAAQDKEYDGSDSATLSNAGTLSGKVTGDAVTFATTATFNNKNVENTKTLNLDYTLSGDDKDNYTLSDATEVVTSAKITKKDLAVTYTASNKTYDATTNATVSESTSDVISGDTVTISETAAFSDKNVASGKTVNVSSIALAGTDAANYNLTNTTASTTANIIKKDLAVTYTASNKTYDATTNATVSESTSDVISGDTVTISETAAFSDKNVASGKTVNVSSIALAGTDAANYNLTNTTASTTANIIKKDLAVTYTASNKTYDATTNATVSESTSDVISGDTVTISETAAFSDKNVASGKTVNVSSIALAGTDADNYNLTNTIASTTANITPKEVTLIASKTYDGTTDLTGDVTITTGVGSETLTYSNATSNDAHVATTNKYINAITLADGENNGLASNYALPTLNNANAAVTINAATLTPTISNTGVTKTYDGTTNAPSGFTPTYTFAGLVSGDTVAALNYTGAAYDDKDVADVTKITLSGLSINSITGTNDSLASDYVLDATSKEVSALITKADLEVSGLIAQDKTYDALQTATLSGTASVTVFGSDDVTLGGTAAGTFDDKNVGTSKVVTVTGNTISGSDAVNYNLVQQAGLTADIIKAALTVTAADRTKVYGSSLTLGSSDFTSDGLVNSETIGSVTLNSANSYAASTTQDVSTYSNEIQISNAVDGTFDISNYDVTYEAGDLDITKKALSVNYLGTNKTYDGRDVVNVSGTLSGIINSDTVTLSQTAAFDNVNVGNDRDISISSIALSGVDADNYSITSTSSTTADISKAALTVTANDDAKFVTQNDSTFTASYAGFVNAETSSILGGTLAITRTNSGTDTAGTYNDVLEASGYTSNNYDISYENGNFIIVPADELLVKVINVSNAYGTATQYALNSVEYYNSNDSSVVTLGSGGSTTSIDGDNLVSINDGAGGTASFTISPQNNTTSTAGKLEVGSYQLGIDGLVTENSNNFSDTVTIVGAHEVTQKSLTASASNVSKVYDGNTSMNGVTIGLDTLETNDVVSVDGSGAFSSKNQGTGLSYTVNNLVLAGTDASNYYLSGGTSFSGSNGVITKKDLSVSYTATDKTYDGSTTATVTESTNDIVSGDSVSISETSVFTDKNVGTNKTVNITSIALGGDDAGNYNLTNIDQEASTSASISRLDSVTWIGGASGNWFDPSNWAGGAVPDLSNVANVVIPTGTVVSFDTTGSVSPADSTSAVNIDSLGTLGSLNMTNGVLNVQDSITLDTFTQNGGTLTAEDFTVTNEYSQGTSGSVVVSGDTDITDNSNGTVIGNLETSWNYNYY